jgi:hypothetical protein
MKHRPTPHPYRRLGELPSDDEAAALALLASKARRARRIVGVPILLGGLVAAIAGYRLLGRLFFAAIEERAPYVAVLITALPIFVLGQALASFAGRRAVLARSKAWIEQVRGAPDVSPALLEAFVRLL